MVPYTIGVDLGGTNIKVGVVTPDGRISATESIPTQAQHGPEHVITRIIELIKRLRRDAEACGHAVVAVGVATPGPMSARRGVIHRMANLPGWNDVPIRDRIHAGSGLPAILENDANAAAWGEFVAGAGSAAQSLVMLTLGTGVGGGIVVDGRLLRGHYENAAEIGHMIIEPGGRACPCGQRGCLERYASAAALGERAMEALDAGRESALRDRHAATGEVTSRDVADLRDSDALAGELWSDCCRALALACVNLQHLLNPEVITLGGGLTAAGEALRSAVREQFHAQTWNLFEDFPRITLAALGNDAGVIGAGSLAREAATG